MGMGQRTRCCNMANTRVQIEVEDWVRREWLSNHLGQTLYRERIQLLSGGVFEFDAVSSDETICCSISTSKARTRSGKLGVGKFMKIRSDMYFLLLTSAKKKYIVLTESDMHELCEREQESGRIHPDIEFVLATIPNELRAKLEAARQIASDEVAPGANNAKL